MPATHTPPASQERWKSGLVFITCVYLAGLTWLVFGQTLHEEFISFDDADYVFQNKHVIPGLSFQGIRWAFTHTILELWSPLTTVSHMLDCQLFGLAPAGHHLTNVLLHMASAVELRSVLRYSPTTAGTISMTTSSETQIATT